jgi:DNA polymerase-3 subunit delta'
MRKPDEKGKLPQDIAVDEVRQFLSFFTLKAALGGRRIGIIDSLDELNRFGANAILKTLEEPPPGAFLILLTHGSRPVLPTIRSRCRRLRLAALSGSETRQVLEAASTAEDPVNAERVAAMAPGRPGQALRLAGESGMAAGAAVAAIAAQWPRPGEAALAGFVMATGADAEGLEAGGLAILQWLSQKAREARGREQAGWARAWLDTSRDLAAARELAMDPTQVAALISERLQALSKR